VIRYHVYITSAIFTFLLSQQSLAARSKAPNAGQWVKEVNLDLLDTVNAPRKVAFVDSFTGGDAENGEPVFAKINPDDCVKSAYFACVSPMSMKFSALLNPGVAPKGFAGIERLTGADTIFFVEKGDLKAYFPHNKSTVDLKTKATSVTGQSMDILSSKLFKGLGYDGVILAVSGKFFLVGATPGRFKNQDAQGLIVDQSHKDWLVVKQETKGKGLIQMVGSSGAFGVFQQVVSTDAGAGFPVGSKVILEK
jgi:hypothetical protein